MRSISKNELRSSEHVSPSHPDKVCDLIAERLLYATKQQNPDAFFACDGSIKNNVLTLVGEVSDRLDKKEENRIIYDTLEELGYGVDYCEAFDLKAYGSRFGWYINKTFTEQSRDINIGVTSPAEGLAAGDIGIMFGYAVDEAPDLTYLPHWIARVILRDLYGVWKDHRYTVKLRPDMKCLVTMGYLYGKPVSIKKVVVCVSHAGTTSQIAPAVLSLVKSKLDYIVHLLNLDDTVIPEISINPTGEFSIFGPVGDSGCIAEGEVVITTKGMARIEDIQVGDVVLTEKGEFPVYQVLDQGEKETVIVTDRHGHSVRVTPDHPFAVFTKNGIVYKEAKDLTDEDEIVRVNRFSEWDNRPTIRKFKVGRGEGVTCILNTNRKNQMYLLGWLIGDGNTTHDDNVAFYYNGEDEKEVLERFIREEWGLSGKVYEYDRVKVDGSPGTSKDSRIVISSKSLVSLLRELGFNATAREKRIPEFVFKLDKYLQAAFLRGLFDSDGHHFITESGRNCGLQTENIGYVSASKRLIQDISVVLQKFGIQSTICYHQTSGRINCYGSYIKATDAWNLHIPGRASREILNKIIGNELTRKQVRERVRDYEYLYSDRRSYPRWAVKPLVALDQKLYLRYNLGKYVDATVDKLDNRISIQKLTHILNIYGVYKDTPEWQLAHSLTNYDLVSLASVEKAGICRCYDLNVETDHSFTANGFLVHNCVGRKIVCDQYGGAAPVGGGNLNGKDASKVDRSGVYMARYMAKKIVWEGLAREAVVQLAYEIGKPEAVSVNVRTDGTPFWKNRTLRNFVKQFDTSVPAIIERFGLNNLPEHVHDEIAAWGHIGERAEAVLPWEVVR